MFNCDMFNCDLVLNLMVSSLHLMVSSLHLQDNMKTYEVCVLEISHFLSSLTIMLVDARL